MKNNTICNCEKSGKEVRQFSMVRGLSLRHEVATTNTFLHMNRVIYKYEMELKDTTLLYLPKGSVIRSIQKQFGKPCLWAEVPKGETTLEPTIIKQVVDGECLDDSWEYFCTLQMSDWFVVHFYIEPN